jgi:hypothetical protein
MGIGYWVAVNDGAGGLCWLLAELQGWRGAWWGLAGGLRVRVGWLNGLVMLVGEAMG